MWDQFEFSSQTFGDGDGFRQYAQFQTGSQARRGSGPFHAEVKAHRLDSIVVVARELSGVVHGRSPGEGAARANRVIATLVIEGQLVGSNESQFERAEPSEIVLSDMQQPSRVEAQSAQLLTVSVPREATDVAFGGQSIHGRILRSPANRILADFMQSLAEHGDKCSPGAMPSLSRAFTDILSTGDNAGSNASSDMRRQQFVRRETIERHIVAGLADRAMSVMTVSRAAGVSRSALYRLFESEGGVGALIGRRRCEAVREAIESGVHGDLAALARQCGFSGEAEMTRRFSETYQTSPQAYAQARRDAGLGAAASQRWKAWIAEIA